MRAAKYVDPYVTHGRKAALTRKITVSIPLRVLELLSGERTRRQISKLPHASNSELLVEAFLHAFTGQPLPTDEELKTMKAASKTMKAAAKPAAKKSAKKPAAKKTVKAAAKKPAAKKTTAKKAAKKPAKKAATK